MRLSELYFEVSKMVANTKSGEDPVIFVKYLNKEHHTYLDFERTYLDHDGDFVIEVS